MYTLSKREFCGCVVKDSVTPGNIAASVGDRKIVLLPSVEFAVDRGSSWHCEKPTVPYSK